MPDMIEDRKQFLDELKRDLASQTAGSVDLQALLERLVEGLEASVGTLHGVEPSGNLSMLASRGLNEEMTSRVQPFQAGWRGWR